MAAVLILQHCHKTPAACKAHIIIKITEAWLPSKEGACRHVDPCTLRLFLPHCTDWGPSWAPMRQGCGARCSRGDPPWCRCRATSLSAASSRPSCRSSSRCGQLYAEPPRTKERRAGGWSHAPRYKASNEADHTSALLCRCRDSCLLHSAMCNDALQAARLCS